MTPAAGRRRDEVPDAGGLDGVISTPLFAITQKSDQTGAEAAHRPCRPAGWIEAEIPIEGVDYATRQLLRLGTEIQVRAPVGLRRALAREARRIAALHAC